MPTLISYLAQIKTYLESIHFGLGKDKEYFIENLSLLASSGMGVGQSIDSIMAEVRSKEMRAILLKMKDDVESGSSLWRALEKTGLFPEHTISLLRIGEESGKLVQNLKVIGAQEEKERVFRGQLQAAMLYPMFVLTFTIVIGVGVAWFILPKLSTVFTSMKVELPLITKILMAVGSLLAGQGIIIVPLFLGTIAVLLFVVFFYPPTRFLGRNLMSSLPGIGRLIQELEIARFSYLLGTLLEAGIPVTHSLDLLEKATSFPYYQKHYRHLRLHLDEGYSFQKVLRHIQKHLIGFRRQFNS